jgi:uncharacterized protein (DUF433 family)
MGLAPGYVDIGSFIDQREGYKGGRPFIVGTGVTVDRISVLVNIDGLTPEEIADAASLTLPQVHAALAFYLANRDEIEAWLDAEDAAHEKAERLRVPPTR